MKLYDFLFAQGVEIHIEPWSASGEADSADYLSQKFGRLHKHGDVTSSPTSRKVRPMSFKKATLLVLLTLFYPIAVPSQEAQELSKSQASPSAPTPEAVKQATQVIQAAAAQTTQKADSALKALAATQEKVDATEKKLDATNEKVDKLAANEDDDYEHAQRREDATPQEVKQLADRLGAFKKQMDEASRVHFLGAAALTVIGILCGFGSVICSLKNRGTLSACLALA
jgi:hypothetical protein